MKKKLPINLSILKHMRESLNLTLDEVAYKMQKQPEKILKWETGEESPTYIQLEYLAQHIYKRPIAVFFMEQIPFVIDPEADFRALPQDFNRSLPTEIILMYRKAKVMQYNLEELYENTLFSDGFLDFVSNTSDKNISDTCNELRDFLSVSLSEQITWKDDILALKKWRNALENIGITIFKDAFKNTDYSGFCLYHHSYPIIFLNNSMPKTRQIFTLFHEIGHLFFKLGGIDLNNKTIFNRMDTSFNEIETKCNRLAGEFLFPISAFENENKSFSEKNIEELANKYSISREVVLRKYLEKSLINRKTYNFYREKWINQIIPISDKKSAGNYYNTQKAYLSQNYLNTVFHKYYQGTITIKNVAEYLNAKVENVGKIETNLLQGGAI